MCMDDHNSKSCNGQMVSEADWKYTAVMPNYRLKNSYRGCVVTELAAKGIAQGKRVLKVINIVRLQPQIGLTASQSV